MTLSGNLSRVTLIMGEYKFRVRYHVDAGCLNFTQMSSSTGKHKSNGRVISHLSIILCLFRPYGRISMSDHPRAAPRAPIQLLSPIYHAPAERLVNQLCLTQGQCLHQERWCVFAGHKTTGQFLLPHIQSHALSQHQQAKGGGISIPAGLLCSSLLT